MNFKKFIEIKKEQKERKRKKKELSNLIKKVLNSFK